MTERERVLAILRHEQPDQLPWMADLDYWRTGMVTDGTFPAEYVDHRFDDGLQRMHRELGAGFYLQAYYPFAEKRSNVEIKVVRTGNRQETTMTTPVGTLRETTEFSKQSYSWAVTKHLIEDIDDLKIYAYICEHTDYTPNYELAKARYETIGDNGVVMCYTPKSPLMDLLAIHSGVENLTYMEIDDQEEFAALLDQMEETYDKACQVTVESPAECIMIPENISSECVVPFYEKYMKRFHKKWTDRIRAAGKYSFVHQDGTVRGLIRQLSHESGFDVIEAVTPKPIGDVTLEEAASMVAENTIIWGGIPGGMFVENVLPDEAFEAHVKHCIEFMTRSPKFVLGVSDQVVPGSSARRIRRVRELVDQFGSYI